MLTLVTGGARSGKSSHALELARPYRERFYVATSESVDDEMRRRIRRHREERGDRFRTLEEPLDLAAALEGLPPEAEVAVVDCLTVWLGNLLHHRYGQDPPHDPESLAEAKALLRVLEDPPCPLVVVSNEVGMGLISEHALGRAFTDLAGHLNQQVAARAKKVVLLVSGIPMVLKGGPR